METEEFIQLPSSSNSGHGNENDGSCESGSEAIKSDSLPLNSEVINEINEEAPRIVSDIIPESMDTLMMDDFDEDAANDTPAQPVLFEMKESVSVVEKMATGSSLPAENGSVAVQSEIAFSKSRGVKRARITVDEEQPSVHVVYKSLPRESKQKLEELLQQWSRWHSQSCSSSYESNVALESGEETYFPALSVGLDKPSAVTFWVDNQTKIQSSKEFIPLDETSVPLYDRGYSLALTSADGSSSLDGRVEKLDTSRCFNCGSYSHALKDCPKPRDNAAVNNARKQHKSKRNQHPNSRNSTRYYQSSKGGKYDGLTPGALDAETRQLLGLGELDPPPWLNRMRELGYPPGYLDPDMEDQPSGITIFGEEEIKAESEEGEILDTSLIEPSKKMTVEFPGINAPIPENADERLWTPSPSIGNYNSSRSRSQRSRHNHQSSSENVRHYSEQRWSSRDLEDDLPPGCDPGTSPSLSNLYSSRYSYGADYDYNSRSSPSRPWSPTYSRSWSDRGRRSPLVNDGSPSYSHYGSFPYSSPR